ncbi:MAG TPA: FtsX-like permease family protein [Steroidobacteraceae bacterium]|jgi:putative ABC transport system permease protein
MSVASWFATRWIILDAGVFGPMRKTPGRTLLAVLAIALGVALGFAIYVINRLAADEVSLAARSTFGLADLAVETSGTGFDETLYPVIARVPGVAAASPVVEVEAKLVGRRGALTVIGMDGFRSRLLQPSFASLATTMPDDATGLPGSDVAYLSASAARSLGLAQGDRLQLQNGLQSLQFTVAGVLPPAALRDQAAVIDIATAQWKFDRLGKISRINLRLQSGSDLHRVRTDLMALLPPGVRVVAPGEATDDALRLSRAYRSNLTALALVALFTGGFFVYSTQSLAVLRRRREFALLHALGVSRGQQLTLVLMNGVMLGLAGAVLGILLGAGIAKAGLGLLGADLGAGFFRGIEPQLRLQWPEVLGFIALGTLVAIVGTVRPALEAARIPTAAALKAGDVLSGKVRRHGALIVVLFAVAGTVLLLPPVAGLPLPGYAAIALLLVGAIVAMPSLLNALLAKAPFVRAVPYEMAIAHLRGTARYATLSVSAIVVSFSLMVAMAIMVTSFRNSLDAWTQRILPADIYMRVGYTGQSSHLDEQSVAALRAVDGVERLEVSRFAEASLASGGDVTIVARDLDQAHVERTLWVEASSDVELPPGTTPVWISEAAADLFGLRSGATVELNIGGHLLKAFVRGVWRDYEHQRGAVVMERSAYLQLTGDLFVNSVWMWLKPGATEESVLQSIRQRLPAGSEYDLRTPRELRRLSLQAFDRTFAMTYVLELIAIFIGLFGISAGTSAQVLARRSEFGVLRHVGLTRVQIAAMLAIEGAGLGSVGVFAGLLTGSVVSLILIYVVNRQSFHWSMDLSVPLGLVAGLSAALVAAAALIAVFSGRQAMRRDVVGAVKEDW